MSLNPSAIFFNGTTDYAKLPVAASCRNQGTVTWIFRFVVGENSTRVDQKAYEERQGTGTLDRFAFIPIKDKLIFNFSPKDGIAPTAYTYNTKWDDRWHCASFTARLGGETPTYTIILDGTTVAEGTLVAPAELETISDTAPKGIYMGNHSRLASGESFPASYAWHGFIDDVILTKDAVGESEIAEYINSDDHYELPDENVLAYWRLNENTGTTSVDAAFTPTRSLTLYRSGAASSALWTPNRPFLGDGLVDTAAPSVPTTNTTANITADGFDASWSASTDNVWVQFYELQVSEFANFASYVAYDMSRLQSKDVRGLLPATNYYWRVRAFDAKLNASAYSSTRSLTTLTVGDITPPNPPTALVISSLTHSTAHLAYAFSSSIDAVGYKIDVATDADFVDRLTSYNNEDVGNVNSLNIIGLQPLTTYYVRVRSYDPSYNESSDSVVVSFATLRRPDITPPLPAVLHAASGISSRTAILSWDEGVDDTGVVGYYLDVSESPVFSGYVTANNIYWDTVDVGNVTEYKIVDLEPDTTYYWRVRAYDDALNVASSVDPDEFTTAPPSIYEGDMMLTTLLPQVMAVVSSTTPTIPSPLTSELTELSVSNTTFTYLQVNPSELAGTLDQCILRLYPKITGTIQLRVIQGTFDEGMTYITRPTMTGSALATLITTPNNWLEIDLSSKITSTLPHIIQIETPSPTAITFGSGNEDPTPIGPEFLVTTDPLTATGFLPLDVDILANERRNLMTNPSFESGASTLWSAFGAGSSVSVIAGGSDGTMELRTVGNTTNTGVQQVSGYIPCLEGEVHTVSFDFKYTNGARSYTFAVDGFNASSVFTSTLASQVSPVVQLYYQRYAMTFTVPAGTVFYRLRLQYTGTNAAYSNSVDNILMEKAATAQAPFTGNSAGATWTGTANSSVSSLMVPTLSVKSPYIGDANENNVAVLKYRLVTDTEWIEHRGSITANRILKRQEAILGPTVPQYNMIVNPSFEFDGLWFGGVRTNEYAYTGNYSYKIPSTVMSGVQNYGVLAGQTYTFQAMVRCAGSASIQLFANSRDSVGGNLGTQNSPIFTSPNTWSRVSFTFTTPANTVAVNPYFVSTGGDVYVDAVQLNAGALQPYKDGTYEGCMWEGEPHKSSTALRLLNDKNYVFEFTYTDPEGFFDNTDVTTTTYSEVYTTPRAADNVTTVQNLSFASTDTSIDVDLSYIGDDNHDMIARVEFRRSDLTTWNDVRPRYDRAVNGSHVYATISNLKAGTSYTVRVTLTDTDGVYGALNNVVSGIVSTSFAEYMQENDPHISFGGFVLMGREDGKIAVRSHDAFGFPTRRMRIEDIPRLDGAVELQSLWGRKTIEMDGFMSGDSRGDLEEVRGVMVRGLAPKQQRLVIDTLAKHGRFYYGTCESLEMEENETTIRHLNWRATFVCADPFAYDLSETVVPTFNVLNGGSTTLTNQGDASIHPYVTVATTSVFPIVITITNTTTGERISPKTTLVSGDRLIIDSDRKSLTKNGVEVDYSGSFLHLGVGGNELSFALNVQRTSALTEEQINAAIDALATTTVAVDVRWRNKYL